MHPSSARLPLVLALFAAGAIAGGRAPAWSAEPTVLAVAAVDSYADVKKQLMWLGGQIGQPALAVVGESMLMMATQGRGLNGLDTSRPLGVVVTTDGKLPHLHGYIPVKNLDRLLESLQASIGAAEKDGAVRRVTMPSGTTIEFTERVAPSGGWAVAALPGSPAGMADPLPALESVAAKLSIGLRVFPSLMPESLRGQFRALLDQAAARAAAQGQAIAPGTVDSFVAGLADTESFALGMAVDGDAKQVFVETDVINVAGSPAAKRMAAAEKAALTVGLPPQADGRPAAKGHIAQIIPADMQPAVIQSLDAAIEQSADAPLLKTLATLVRNLVASALGTGSLEAAFVVDTSTATEAAPLPALTAGLRVKDGRALEAELKRLLGDGSLLPKTASVAFDTGTAGAATLHTVRLAIDDDELARRLGDTLELTLAVAPGYAFVLTGGDVKQRAAAAAAASGQAVADAKPIADVQIAVDEVMHFGHVVGREPQAEKGAAAAREAGGGTMHLEVRPVDRGVSTRLTADAAVLKGVAASAQPPQPAASGLPGGVPLPQGFPIPVPVR